MQLNLKSWMALSIAVLLITTVGVMWSQPRATSAQKAGDFLAQVDNEEFDDGESEDEEEEEFEGEEEEFENENFEEEEHDEWFHEHQMEMEMRHMELETVRAIAEIADNEVASAAFALMHLEEVLEEEDAPGAIEFLTKAAGETDNPGVRRLLRIKLAELNMHVDNIDGAKEQFKALILNK